LNHDDHIDSDSDISKHNEIKNQNLKQDNILDKPSQIIDNLNKEIITEEATTYNPSNDTDTDTLSFEFSWSFKEVRNYLTPLYRTIGDNGRIWFGGRINKNTGQIISHHFGRLNQQQRQHLQHDDEYEDRTDSNGADEL